MSRETDEMLYAPAYFTHGLIDDFPDLIDGSEHVWDCLDRLGSAIEEFLGRKEREDSIPGAFDAWVKTVPGRGSEKVLTAISGFVAETDLVLPEWGIFIGKNTVVEPTAMIKSPAYIGAGCEIRQGAYLRGGTIIGPVSTVGHNTEIKNSVFLGHTEAGHFAYIGDSILGKYVNLGAGTKLANLPFRTLPEKQTESFPEFRIEWESGEMMSGRSKLGAVLGDGVETGCNSTLAPMVFLGPDTWVYPCMYVPRGFYPARRIIKPGSRIAIIPKRP